jgi:hypothetical protein
MASTQPLQVVTKSRTLRVTWLLSGILAFFPIFSLWVIPKLHFKFFEIPALTEPGTFEWITVFVLGSIGCVVLLVGLILAFQSHKIGIGARLLSAIAVAVTLSLWGYWFYVTTTKPVKAAMRTHSVVLTWKPSTSKVVGYNIYRSTTPGDFPGSPINASPVSGTTYTDKDVDDNTTYYYGAKAVNAKNIESDFSNVAQAPVP